MALDTRVVRRFAKFLTPHPWYLVGAVAAAILSSAAQLVQPLMFGQAISVGTSGTALQTTQVLGFSLTRIDVVCVEFALSFIVFTAMSIVSQSMSTRLAQKVIFDLRRAMFEHFQTISLSYMDRTHVGRIMSRLQGDVNALQDFLESTTSSIGDLLMLIGIVALLLIIDWKLGLLTLLVLPALIGIRAIYLPYNKKAFRRRARRLGDRQRGAGREHQRRAHRAGDPPRGDELRALRGEGARHDGDADHTPPRSPPLMTPTVVDPHRRRHGDHHRGRRLGGDRPDARSSAS